MQQSWHPLGMCIALMASAASSNSVCAATAVKLSGALRAGYFSITPDGSHIVFDTAHDGASDLYSARIDGMGASQLLSNPGGSAFLFNSPISPDSSRIIFSSDETIDGDRFVGTYSSRLDSTSGPILLHRSPILDVGVTGYNIAISSDSHRAIVRAERGDNSFDLLSYPIDGGAAPMMLNPGPQNGAPGAGVGWHWTMAGDHIVFDMQDGTVSSLFSRRFDGSNPPVQLTPTGQQLRLYDLSADKATIMLATTPGAGPDMNLYRTGIDGGPLTPILISDDSHSYQFQGMRASPDGKYVAFTRDFHSSIVKTDGSSAPAMLGPFPDGVERQTFISPDSQWVATISRPDPEAAGELFISPIDASRPPHRLNLPLPPGGDIDSLHFTPDSKHIIYFGDQRGDGIYEMFSVLTNGSAPPVRLGAPGQFVISADGKTLITTSSDAESFVAIPIDGGDPVELFRKTDGFFNGWALSPDGSKIVFEYARGDVSEIFAVAIPEPGFLVSGICAALLLWFRGGRTRARRACHRSVFNKLATNFKLTFGLPFLAANHAQAAVHADFPGHQMNPMRRAQRHLLISFEPNPRQRNIVHAHAVSRREKRR